MHQPFDLRLVRYADGLLTIAIHPPTPVGGMDLRFTVMKQFGANTSLITKSAASGLNNQSGINITDSGQGIFKINLQSVNTSGLEYGNYACVIENLTSGNRAVLAEGWLQLLPGGNP